MIKIDGSYGEGGGQILRTCLTLSAITGKPFILTPIRPTREKSGLRPQHLMACLAVKALCQGQVEGAALNSHSLIFKPNKIYGGKYQFDIGTAGSLILLAQTLIPICLYAKEASTLRMIGGTHVIKSPSYDYFEHVFLPAIAKFGVDIKSRLIKVGYYPKGGGIVELDITPQQLHGCTNWNTDENVFAIIRLSRLLRHIANREAEVLTHHGIKNIVIHEDVALSSGNAITLCKGLKGAYVPGEIGKRAERVAEEAIALLQQENEEVDKHLADQLLIYAVLAEGQTCYRTSVITPHLLTNIFAISHFIDRQILIEGDTILVR